MVRRYAVLLALLLIGLARAEPVTLQLTPDMAAMAEYRQGQADKPAALILHGFLQTHEFSTIHRLTEGLAGEGHTVLAPTLSLGVTHRKQSLACEAIHAHTLEDDLIEIAAWLKWLGKQHKGPIVLVGHSLGSLELLAFVQKPLTPQVKRLVGISIMEGRYREDEAQTRQLREELVDRIKRGDNKPVMRRFSYCQNYLATPRSLLSYLEWTPERILKGIDRARVPVSFIMGSKDERLGPGWLEGLARTSARLRVIEGANHFMDGEHEFDLLDSLIEEMKRR